MANAVFLIRCPDRKGLVASITGFFFEACLNILHCQQHTDTRDGLYFMRIKLDLTGLASSRKALEESFDAFGRQFDLTWSAHYSDYVPRMAILVSTANHCLYNLLVKQRDGQLNCEIPLVIGNHPDLEYVAGQFRVPFYCLPIGKDGKAAQETAIIEQLERQHIDLVVLARYMQILTPALIDRYPDRIINIHHAFLPAFQGGNAYMQAYERGVKMIGATAHYVTTGLDEGPIIEQGVERVTHEYTPEAMARIGRDIESIVLSRAIRAHLESRIIVSGNRTVVFSGGAA
jgi:formyltetrahydrofolate deformylase